VILSLVLTVWLFIACVSAKKSKEMIESIYLLEMSKLTEEQLLKYLRLHNAFVSHTSSESATGLSKYDNMIGQLLKSKRK
jgi:hypothetical protein